MAIVNRRETVGAVPQGLGDESSNSIKKLLGSPLPLSSSTGGRCVLDEECACDERTVREQGSGRKMKISHPARRSERPHLTVFAHFAFEYDRAAIVDNDHLEWWATLAGFARSDETLHFVSQSAGYVSVTHRLYGLMPFALAPRAQSAAGVFHFLFPFKS